MVRKYFEKGDGNGESYLKMQYPKVPKLTVLPFSRSTRRMARFLMTGAVMVVMMRRTQAERNRNEPRWRKNPRTMFATLVILLLYLSNFPFQSDRCDGCLFFY